MPREKQATCNISLWENDSDNESAPTYTGYFKFDIENLKEMVLEAMENEPDDYDQYQLKVAIWFREEDGNKPVMSGTVQAIRKTEKKKRRTTRR